MNEFWLLDAAPLAAVILSGATLAALGSFLILQRQALVGDAMAHSVLPGLVIAFVVTGSRSPWPMFAGALGAALLASVAIGALTRVARVEPSAAIGVVFTTLFALGVLLVETTGARNVDLDLDCVLSGQLELLFWPMQEGASPLARESIAQLPSAVTTLCLLAFASFLTIAIGWRLFTACLFDRNFAATRGLRPALLRYGLLALTTVTIVASFDALGSILVIALLICPAASARLLTSSMSSYVIVASTLGAAAGLIGYFAATRLAPLLIHSTIDASGCVAATAGVMLGITALIKRQPHPGLADPLTLTPEP